MAKNDTEHTIIFNIDTSQAEALLAVMRSNGPSKVAMLQEGIEWATIDKASRELQTVLRDLSSPVGVTRKTEPQWGGDAIHD